MSESIFEEKTALGFEVRRRRFAEPYAGEIKTPNQVKELLQGLSVAPSIAALRPAAGNFKAAFN
jgi:hypothetical protein